MSWICVGNVGLYICCMSWFCVGNVGLCIGCEVCCGICCGWSCWKFGGGLIWFCVGVCCLVCCWVYGRNLLGVCEVCVGRIVGYDGFDNIVWCKLWLLYEM